MFGYVLPCRETLAEEEFTHYQEIYCGICHALRHRYGESARFLLSFDFTFLALLLQQADQEERRCKRRCISHPCRGRCVREVDEVSAFCADMTVLFSWWKFCDSARDDRGIKRLAAIALRRFYRRRYLRAANAHPAAAQCAETQMKILWTLEAARSESLDRPADTFAAMLAAAIPETADAEHRRVLEQVLYHVGRWIYLIDAWDDLREDMKRGRYNPVAARYALTDGADAKQEDAKARLELTLRHSLNLALGAFHLLPAGPGSPIVENILCHGLPVVQELVFSGRWRQQKKQKKTGAI